MELEQNLAKSDDFSLCLITLLHFLQQLQTEYGLILDEKWIVLFLSLDYLRPCTPLILWVSKNDGEGAARGAGYSKNLFDNGYLFKVSTKFPRGLYAALG